jgi:hypothetical protein
MIQPRKLDAFTFWDKGETIKAANNQEGSHHEKFYHRHPQCGGFYGLLGTNHRSLGIKIHYAPAKDYPLTA